MARTIDGRFWSKVKKTNGCWEWTASLNNKGYGVFGNPLIKSRLAHRVSWVLSGKPEPKRLLLHKCDNPKCVRPEHLYLGSQTENMRDILLRDRHHGRSRLNPENVRAIRGLCRKGVNDLETIATQFGVTAATIGHIKYGLTWSWLE